MSRTVFVEPLLESEVNPTVAPQTNQDDFRKSHQAYSSRNTLIAALFVYLSLYGIGLLFMRYLGLMNALGQASFLILWGSGISLVSCGFVMINFCRNAISSRRNPSPVIFFRTLVDFILAVVLFLSNTDLLIIGEKDLNCARTPLGGQLLPAIFEFTAITSDAWFLALCVDLLKKLTNPFTDHRGNMRLYHTLVWFLGCATSGTLILSSDYCKGELIFGVCWIPVLDNANKGNQRPTGCIWGYYLGWVLLFYLFVQINIFRMSRLINEHQLRLLGERVNQRKGRDSGHLSEVMRTVSALTAYCSYKGFEVVCLVVLLYLQPTGKINTPLYESSFRVLSQAFTFVITARGFVDLIVWILLVQDSSNQSKSPVDQRSPQLNEAVRREILHYVTAGVRMAINSLRTNRINEEGDDGTDLYCREFYTGDESGQSDAASSCSLCSEEDNNDEGQSAWNRSRHGGLKGVRFRDYHANVFRRLRVMANIDEDQYVHDVVCGMTSAVGKLSEGASGAFLFYSNCGRYMIKTLSWQEARTLHKMLGAYTDYLHRSPGTLITRFFGSHSLNLYHQEFYFVVMRNVFATTCAINERYDLKGSWVNRTALRLIPGVTATCRHCYRAYIVEGDDDDARSCLNRTEHEPDVVLKDGDFSTKIHLDAKQGCELIRQLELDSNFLASQGIMDYSLLVGVHNVPFYVKPEVTLSRRASRERARSLEKEGESKDKEGWMPSDQSIDRCSGPVDFLEGGNVFASRVVTGPGLYYVGVVDVLQTWSTAKRIESVVKRVWNWSNREGISCISPEKYAPRFQKKMHRVIHYEQDWETDSSESEPTIPANDISRPSNISYCALSGEFPTPRKSADTKSEPK